MLGTESCKTRLIMKCKDQPHGESSQIKNPHNYRRQPGNRKHLQLTSNLFAGHVRQHLKKDLSITV
jgi:hypothetical protein